MIAKAFLPYALKSLRDKKSLRDHAMAWAGAVPAWFHWEPGSHAKVISNTL
jgi:hypothetical protein